MSDLRTQIIRLAHENPELRGELLNILKEADAATCVKNVYNDYMQEHPKSKKKETDKLFVDKCQTKGDGESANDDDGGESGESNVIQFPGGGKPKTDIGEIKTDTIPKKKEKSEKKEKKPAPKLEKVEVPSEGADSAAYEKKLERQKKETGLMESVHKKYEKHQAEDGSFPDDIKQKMNEEYSHGLNKLDKEDAASERKDLLGANKKKREQEAKTHEDKLVAKAEKKFPNNKAQQAKYVEKGMKKYKTKADKKKKQEDQGAIKTFLESYKKWKNLTKTWLNPESNPIVNEFKQASASRVASRHQAVRVASRYRG